MTNRLRHTAPVADERGQSLVMALLVLTFLAVSLTTVLIFTASNQRNSNYRKAVGTARSLAEAGLNNAVSVLSNPNNSASLELSALLPSSEAAAITAGDTKTGATAYQSGTTVTWWGTLPTDGTGHVIPDANGNVVWTLKGKATVPNPTGPSASPIVRTMTARVNVNAPLPSSFNVGVWNTVYSPLGPTAGCDTSVGQGVNVTVPMYVGGNLCMANSSSINAPLYVGGYLNISNKQAWIGCSKITGNSCQTAAPINSAHVGAWCAGPSNPQYTPCVSEPMPVGKLDTNIFVKNPTTWSATGQASDFIGITPPKICWSGSQQEVLAGACNNTPPGGWYSFASPGPYFPCAAGSSGTGLPVFDKTPLDGFNDTYYGTPFNLTPSTPYSCMTGQGQLTWSPSTRTLTVVGTVFFDGSVTMTTTGNQPIRYTGTASGGNCTNGGDCQAVIYAAGDVSINSEMLCAVINSNNTDCDWNNWDPNKKLLIFAANGPNGVTVGPSQTSFQGGLYATNTVTTGQSAVTEGPLVSGTKTVVLGQQFGGTFPPITIAPFSINQQPGGFYISPPYNIQSGSS